MPKKNASVNYLYYGFFFLLLILFSSSTIFSRGGIAGSQFFFFLYALGQSFLETLLFLCGGQFIERFIGRKSFLMWVGLSFVILCTHALDFMTTRVLDLSIFESFQIFVWEEKWSNFIYLLDASGIPLWMWGSFFLLAACWPLLGIAIYLFTDKISRKRPLFLFPRHALQAFIAIPCALAFWDFSAAKVIHPDGYTNLIKAIPWKITFFHPENIHLSFLGTLKTPPQEKEISALLDTQKPISIKPNIYLFIIETLREDAITKEIAPNLYQFKNDSTHFEKSVSNANGTMCSWFSIFFSQFAFYWADLQPHWSSGSPALQHLKKLGYNIRLYTSAQLSYYGLEKLIFGKELQLIDSYQKFHHTAPANPAESDAAAIEAIRQDLKDPKLQEGQVFITFLDATHFDYSWPKTWNPQFTPVSKALSCFQIFPSKHSIRLMKNRYWSSVNYIDYLFGRFLQDLPNQEEAVIAVAGDHGEEFFEKGNLFHNSHLVDEQMNVPLYMKFGDQQKRTYSRPVISQMDIFPSIIDYVSNETPSYLNGQSVFRPVQWPYALTARFNGASTPYEFCLHNGPNKLLLQFSNRANIFDSRQLRILSLRTKNDQSFLKCTRIKSWIRQEFGPALRSLFEKKEPASKTN